MPHRLRAGPREHDVAEAFEFLKPAAVEKLITGDVLCDASLHATAAAAGKPGKTSGAGELMPRRL